VDLLFLDTLLASFLAQHDADVVACQTGILQPLVGFT